MDYGLSVGATIMQASWFGDDSQRQEGDRARMEEMCCRDAFTTNALL